MRKLLTVACLSLLTIVSPAQTAQEWRDSLYVLAKAIDNNPYSIELRLKKAAVNIELGQWEYAADEYGRVLEIDKRNLTALYFRAYANTQLQRYEMARNDYEQILFMVPKHFEAQLGLAMVHRKMENKVETLDCLNQLVQFFPDSAIAYAARAGYEAEQRMYDVALFDWDEAIKLDTANLEFYVSKVDVLLAMDRKRDARRVLNEAIAKGASPVALKEWLERCK